MRATDIVLALLDGRRAKEFIMRASKPSLKLAELGFYQLHGNSRIWGKSYPRPESLETPYNWGDLVLSVQEFESGECEIGLCTMGQFGHDYPDIWLGRFSPVQAMRVIKELLHFMPDVDGANSYEHLVRTLRLVVRSVL